MKITFGRAERVIHLRDYGEHMGDQTVTVWVNPPAAMIAEYVNLADEIQTATKGLADADEDAIAAATADIETKAARMMEILGGLCGMTPDDLKAIYTAGSETDPQFYNWLVNRIIGAVFEHRTAQKKA